jgi:hypothetical protein
MNLEGDNRMLDDNENQMDQKEELKSKQSLIT